MSTVTELKQDPFRLTPEMVIRYLMRDIDKMEQIAVVCKTNSNAPRIYISTGISPYVLAAGAAMMHDAALDGLNGHEINGNEKAPG